MMGIADFIQLGGFLTELSFPGFNKPVRKFQSIICQHNMGDFEREKFQTPIHKIFRIFTALGFIDSIKQTSGSPVNSNKQVTFLPIKFRQISYIYMEKPWFIFFKLFCLLPFLLRHPVYFISAKSAVNRTHGNI